MSRIAVSRIEGTGNTFHAVFNLEGYSKKFTGSFSSGVMNFKSSMATLKYDTPTQLHGAYRVTVSPYGGPSFVGEEELQLSLQNEGGINLSIQGTLDIPTSERQTVNGQGEWSDA